MYCRCGCGKVTNKRKTTGRGYRKGEHLKYILGHNNNGERSHFWKDGSYLSSHGYVMKNINPNNYKYEHIVIAEKALGKKLPPNAEIHHMDENRSNNSNSNLVICQDKSYHKLLHTRINAKKACGNANFKKCYWCNGWDSPDKILYRWEPHYISGWHKECNKKYQGETRKYYRSKKI